MKVVFILLLLGSQALAVGYYTDPCQTYFDKKDESRRALEACFQEKGREALKKDEERVWGKETICKIEIKMYVAALKVLRSCAVDHNINPREEGTPKRDKGEIP